MPFYEVADVPFEGVVPETAILLITTPKINGKLCMVEVLSDQPFSIIKIGYRSKVIIEDQETKTSAYYYPEVQTNSPLYLEPFNTYSNAPYYLNDPLSIEVHAAPGTRVSGIVRYV